MDPVPAPTSRMVDALKSTLEATRRDKRGELGATAPTERGSRSKDLRNTSDPDE